MTTYQALFELAAHPEYIAPLREEIERVIAEDGYSVDESGAKNLMKQSFPKLKKLDSLLKETQRRNPAGIRKCFLPFFLLLAFSCSMTVVIIHGNTRNSAKERNDIYITSHIFKKLTPPTSQQPPPHNIRPPPVHRPHNPQRHPHSLQSAPTKLQRTRCLLSPTQSLHAPGPRPAFEIFSLPLFIAALDAG